MAPGLELQILFCALALGIIQLLLSATLFTLDNGLPYAVSPRDTAPKQPGKIAGRAARAYNNFIETFVLFAAAVLLVNALGKASPTADLGAQVYIWARLAYVPLYIAGIPYLRTLAWTASLVGIVMVLAAIWPGV
jgi:uncharacterized MAPEG superfamily protein